MYKRYAFNTKLHCKMQYNLPCTLDMTLDMKRKLRAEKLYKKIVCIYIYIYNTVGQITHADE